MIDVTPRQPNSMYVIDHLSGVKCVLSIMTPTVTTKGVNREDVLGKVGEMSFRLDTHIIMARSVLASVSDIV